MYYHHSRTRILLTSDSQAVLMPASSLSRPWIPAHAHRTSHIAFYVLRITRSQVAGTNVDEPQPSRMLIPLALAFVFHSNPIPARISLL